MRSSNATLRCNDNRSKKMTPDTLNYMLGGYIVFSLTFFGYLVYLWMRWKNLQAEEKTLQELDSQE
jgi:hypothetical protein